MSEPRRESPLVGQKEAIEGAPGNDAVVLRERPFLGHVSIRGSADDQDFVDACSRVLGVALPTRPNTQAVTDAVVACWLGPTEWLIICGRDARQQWLDDLRAAVADMHAGVVDLTGGQTLIEIRGTHAVDTLAKGMTLDLHSRSFGADQCTRTMLAKSAAFIRVLEPGQAFQIVVRRSFADYVWQWLVDAAGEYDYSVAQPAATLQATDA